MNPRQQHFVQEYLIDPNATQAAIRACYSKKTARSIGQENLTKPDIAAAIEKAQAERGARAELTADMVVRGARHPDRRTTAIDYLAGRANEICPHGRFKRTQPRVRSGTHGRPCMIAIRALDLLGRHLGMWKDKVEHGAEVSLLDALRRIEAKEDAAK